MLRSEAYSVPFDKGFVDRDVVRDQISIGKRTQNGEEVENFRSVSASIMLRGDARSTRSDRCDESGHCPRRIFHASARDGCLRGRVSREMYRADLECRSIDRKKVILSREQNRLFELKSSSNSRHELVMKSSRNGAEYLSSSSR